MGLHGRFQRGLTANQIKVLRATSTQEEEYGIAERVKELVDRLLSTTEGQNLASLMKIADAGGLITATTVEGALAELATAVGSVDVLGALAAATSAVSVNGQKITDLGAPTSANDAARKADLDTLAAGIRWKPPVAVRNYVGTRTIAQIDAIVGPGTGLTVVAGDAGIPAAGASDALVAGDIAEYDGTQWQKLVSAVGGFVPDGTVVMVHDSATLYAPLTDVTDRSKVATFDGTSNTPALSVPVEGDGRVVVGDGSVFEHRAYVYDAVLGWNPFVAYPAPHAGQHVGGSFDAIPGAVAGGAAGLMTGADKTKLDGVEAAADVTDQANVQSAGAVQWFQKVIAFGDLAGAGATKQVTLMALAGGDVLYDGMGRLTAEFSGGGVVSCTMSMGRAGAATSLFAAKDVFTGSGLGPKGHLAADKGSDVRTDADGGGAPTKLGSPYVVSAPEDLVAEFTVDGGHVTGDLTAGSVIVRWCIARPVVVA